MNTTPTTPTTLYVSRTYMRRFAALFVAVPLMLLVLLGLTQLLAPAKMARPWAPWLPVWWWPWGFAALYVGVAALGCTIIIVQGRTRKPVLTLTPEGMALRDGYFVPWLHVTAIRRPPKHGMQQMSVELVSEHWELRAQARGLTGWAAWKARFLSPVMAVGPSRVPTVFLMPEMVGLKPEELLAAMERYRAAAQRDALISGGSRNPPAHGHRSPITRLQR